MSSPGPCSPLSWSLVEQIARSLPEKSNLVVPKSALGLPPPHARSRLGRRRGALRQFRCGRRENNLHVKEYADRWVVHVDRWNPHLAPIRHLLVDRGYNRFLHLAEWLPLEPTARAPAPAPAE